jgi:hypothetical protein
MSYYTPIHQKELLMSQTMTTTEELSPPDILHAWQGEAECLQKELARLESSTSLADVDALALIKVKLTHIEARLPDLGKEAAQYEHAQLRVRIRTRDEPRWKTCAEQKRVARAGLVRGCAMILEAMQQYGEAHRQQCGMLSDVPDIRPDQRGAYAALIGQLATVGRVLFSGAADAPMWLQRLRDFDPPGTSDTLPHNGQGFFE